MTDLDQVLRLNLLSRLLLDNSSSPLMHALETTPLGSAPSPLCGLDDSARELLFAAGVEGSEPEHAEAVEQLVLGVLAEVAETGVPAEQVEAMLHQIELGRREIGGDRYPYGLQLIMNALPQAVHHGDPVQALAIDAALERLRAAAAEPGFVQNEVRRWLLDNPHRVRLTMKPDATQAERERAAEQARRARRRRTPAHHRAGQGPAGAPGAAGRPRHPAACHAGRRARHAEDSTGRARAGGRPARGLVRPAHQRSGLPAAGDRPATA
jgi:Zn-dependent M16 (insulinase) family peptidase